MSPDVTGAFVRFLAMDVKYAYGSITDVIIPSLKRIHLERCDSGVGPQVNASLVEAQRFIRSKSANLTKSSKEPAISSDLKRIIDGFPITQSKLMVASLYLFAMPVGARAITASNVELRDIKAVRKLRTGNLLVSVELRVTKGNDNWNHPVTIEGDPQSDRDLRVGCRIYTETI